MLVKTCAGNLRRGRFGGKYGGVAGDDPGLGVLRDLQVLVGSGVLDTAVVAVIDDEAELAGRTAAGGVDGNVEVDAEAVRPGLRHLA